MEGRHGDTLSRAIRGEPGRTRRRWILEDFAAVEPLLRAGATAEIDARAPLGEVVDALERIAVAADSSADD